MGALFSIIMFVLGIALFLLGAAALVGFIIVICAIIKHMWNFIFS